MPTCTNRPAGQLDTLIPCGVAGQSGYFFQAERNIKRVNVAPPDITERRTVLRLRDFQRSGGQNCMGIFNVVSAYPYRLLSVVCYND